MARGSYREDHIKRNCSRNFKQKKHLGREWEREIEITLAWCHVDTLHYTTHYTFIADGALLELHIRHAYTALERVPLGHRQGQRHSDSFAPESKQICCSANFPRCCWPMGHLSASLRSRGGTLVSPLSAFSYVAWAVSMTNVKLLQWRGER